MSSILPMRTSPLHARLAGTATAWATRNRMATVAAYGAVPVADSPVWLADASHRFRFGFKGAGASAWCASQGLPLPGYANTYSLLEGGGLIGRLATSEFYVEHEDERRIDALRAGLGRGVQTAEGGVYPVHRCDAGLVLGGPQAGDVFAQTCNVDFAALDVAERPLIMTLIVGVAVTVFPQVQERGVEYRMVCDPTFAPWLWSTLAEIVVEAGGGLVAD